MKKLIMILVLMCLSMAHLSANVVFADEGDLTVVIDEGFDFGSSSSTASTQEVEVPSAVEETTVVEPVVEETTVTESAETNVDPFAGLNITGISKSSTVETPTPKGEVNPPADDPDPVVPQNPQDSVDPAPTPTPTRRQYQPPKTGVDGPAPQQRTIPNTSAKG